ncbi:serine protease [Desulfococcaceae bacterium HSG8]|nr:serine protease [Desulfococcaceae bacterium HSG8]
MTINQGDKVAEKYKNNVVKIEVKFDNASAQYGMGFIVGERNNELYIVTANHVIRGKDDNPTRPVKMKDCQVTFYQDQGKSCKAEPLDVIDSKFDIALLRVKKTKSWYVWKKGIFCFDYRRGEMAWYFGRHWVISLDKDAGMISQSKQSSNNGYIECRIDNVPPGASGSPFFTKNGIIGMIIESDGFKAVAVSIDIIKGLIEKKEYPWNKIENIPVPRGLPKPKIPDCTLLLGNIDASNPNDRKRIYEIVDNAYKNKDHSKYQDIVKCLLPLLDKQIEKESQRQNGLIREAEQKESPEENLIEKIDRSRSDIINIIKEAIQILDRLEQLPSLKSSESSELEEKKRLLKDEVIKHQGISLIIDMLRNKSH